jgi:hypothetical protein
VTHLSIPEPPGTEAWSTKIRRRARTLIRTIDQGYMELAEIIYKVWDTPVDGDARRASVAVAWGYRGYLHWAQEELGLNQQKTMRLRTVWERLEVQLGDKLDPKTKRRIVKLGLSKVRVLVQVISETNAEVWAEMAENLTQHELEAAVARARKAQKERNKAEGKPVPKVGELDEEWDGADPPEDIERFKWQNFFLAPEQNVNVMLALDRARELAESKRKGHLLDLICTEFLATNTFLKPDDPDTPLRFLAKFERLMGKRLVIVNPETWEIEYGMDALEQVASAAERAIEESEE